MENIREQAKQNFLKRRYYWALKKFQVLVNEEPDNANVHAELAQCYAVLNRLELAVQEALQAIALDEDSIIAYDILSSVYFKLGKYEESHQATQKILKLAPDSPYAYHALARWARKDNQYHKVIEYLKQAISVAPENDVFYLELAAIYLKTNEKQMAWVTFKQALRVAPSLLTFWVMVNCYRGYYRLTFLLLPIVLFIWLKVFVIPSLVFITVFLLLDIWFTLKFGKYRTALFLVGFLAILFLVGL